MSNPTTPALPTWLQRTWFRAWGPRRLLVVALLLCGVLAGALAGLSWQGLMPTESGWRLVSRFTEALGHPAVDYEDRTWLGAESPLFFYQILDGMLETLRIACAAVSLSVVVGVLLGFLACAQSWGRGRGARLLWLGARAVITLFRSVHELIWATLLLAAVGLTPLTGVLAIAITYSGTLAKVFSEMAEEAPPAARQALEATGAGAFRTFICGVCPRVVADLLGYALYRFECGLRSAAVLGFLGVPTLGYHLRLAFENTHYREVWSYLIALLLLVWVFDAWSGLIRSRMTGVAVAKARAVPRLGEMNSAEAKVGALWQARPGSAVLRLSLLAIAGLSVWAWLTVLGSSVVEVRWANLTRFAHEIMPYPLQQGEGASALLGWLERLLTTGGGLAAMGLTLALSIAAVVLAGVMGGVLAPLAARTVATVSPWIHGHASPIRGALWGLLRRVVRFLLAIARAVPEYIWAFLFVGLFSQQAWAAVMALAIHNAGILGRLGSDVLESAAPAGPVALRATGASRSLIVGGLLFPASLGRWLVFFFYRWETCLREATVLGLLGLGTLGRLVQESRARLLYDEMMLYVLLGATLVFAGDLVSSLVRRAQR